LKYIYDNISNEMIDKLKENKLSKNEENELKYKFLKINKMSGYSCLNHKKDSDEDTLRLRKRFVINNVKVIFLSLVLFSIIVFSILGYISFVEDGLNILEKVLLALMLFIFHIILVIDIVMIFNIQRIIDENILNKIRKY